MGDGWRRLIEDTFARLDALNASHGPRDPDAILRVLDVKEKYGTLRIDVVPYDDEAEAVVNDAEAQSEKICDVCGSTGRMRGERWLSTRCDRHAQQ